jgi:hypothetical protein
MSIHSVSRNELERTAYNCSSSVAASRLERHSAVSARFINSARLHTEGFSENNSLFAF